MSNCACSYLLQAQHGACHFSFQNPLRMPPSLNKVQNLQYIFQSFPNFALCAFPILEHNIPFAPDILDIKDLWSSITFAWMHPPTAPICNLQPKSYSIFKGIFSQLQFYLTVRNTHSVTNLLTLFPWKIRSSNFDIKPTWIFFHLCSLPSVIFSKTLTFSKSRFPPLTHENVLKTG